MRILCFAALRERAGCAEALVTPPAEVGDVAFQACRLMIDRAKTAAALWKREDGPARGRRLSPAEAEVDTGSGNA